MSSYLKKLANEHLFGGPKRILSNDRHYTIKHTIACYMARKVTSILESCLVDPQSGPIVNIVFFIHGFRTYVISKKV